MDVLRMRGEGGGALTRTADNGRCCGPYRRLQSFKWRQVCRDVPRYVPIAAGYCRTGGGGEGAFMASVTTRFLHDAAGRIKEVLGGCLIEHQRGLCQSVRA